MRSGGGNAGVLAAVLLTACRSMHPDLQHQLEDIDQRLRAKYPHFSHDVRVIASLRDPSRGQSRTKGGAARRVVWGCGSSENAAPRICPTGTEARVATRLLMRWTLSRFLPRSEGLTVRRERGSRIRDETGRRTDNCSTARSRSFGR